tara:strand:+ start:1529 stop:1744 length:216 start_codon:yes stop_codon:yes gene_type:complete
MKHVNFDKSPMGFHVYQEGEKHPVGWLKQANGRGSNDYYVIHNRLKADKQGVAFPLWQAKKLITKLINGEG